MIGSLTAAELDGFSLFHGLPPADLALVAAAAERRDLADGSVIHTEGGPATELCLVERGQVALRITRDGRQIIVGVFGADEVLGWSCLREDPVALTTARASGPVRLVAIPAEALLEAMTAGTPTGRTLVRRIVDIAALDLAATREQIVLPGREGVITGG